jgi:hypothetical protein
MRDEAEEFTGGERGKGGVQEFKSVRVKARRGDGSLGGKTRGLRSFARKARSG